MNTADIDTDPIARAAAERPDKTAVIASSRRLDYAGLDGLVDRAAAWIADRMGRDPSGERVAYMGRNGLELVALAFGAERCGAIFVPLNWRLAGTEIAALLDDCAPRIVVAQAEFGPLPAGHAAILDALGEISETPGDRRRAHDADRPIVLLYTSGTTGRPKGVIVTAANADAAARNFRAVGEVTANAVVFSDLPMFHTIGLIAVARTTLMTGGTLVLADRFQPERTLATLADAALGVSHYFAVPVMAGALIDAPQFDPAALRHLQAIFVGGSPLSPELIGRYRDAGLLLVNGYGMSEAGTAIHVPIGHAAAQGSAGAVGLPAPEIEVRLVRDGGDVPQGEVGEIWLRGPSVTPGYWRRPEETAAAFSDGWYRTGDLARREPDGSYRLVDRLKDMYVSGGENVYPAEVEAVLRQHPGVADAAVIGVPDARWGESGVAFVVPQPGTSFDPEALAAALAGRIARYKCPARYVAVDAIPRSAAGKILKPVLRERLSRGEFA